MVAIRKVSDLNSKLNQLYFLIIDINGQLLYTDNNISNYLGLSKDDYINIMVKECNGQIIEDSLYFNNFILVSKAKKWLEKYMTGFLIAKKLTKEEIQ